MTLTKVLREYERHVAPRTAMKVRHQIARWVKYGQQDSIKVETQHFDQFRKSAATLAATTIEDTINDIRTLIKFQTGKQPDPGRRLKRQTKTKPVPSVATIGAAYLAAGSATWPNNPRTHNEELRRISNRDFWRAFIVVGYWCGLRLSDLIKLEWDAISESHIEVSAGKTGKTHRYPMPEIVAKHIEPLRAAGLSRPFAVARWAGARVRRELAKMHAGFGPQAMRRSAITSWACASPEAGRIVHGERLGVLKFYYDTERILDEAGRRFQWPDEVLEGAGMTRTLQRRVELMAALGNVPDDRVDDVLKVTKALSR